MKKEKNNKRKWSDYHMEVTTAANPITPDTRPTSRTKTTSVKIAGAETTPTIAHWLKETTMRPLRAVKNKTLQE